MEKLIDRMVRQYLETALWSSNDESTPQGGVPLDRNYEISDISKESVERAKADCQKFYDQAEVILGKNGDEIISLDETKLGHDFWLSRNRHGAGFFDADYLDDEMKDALQDLAESFGEVNLIVGDDEVLYMESNISEAKDSVADPVLLALDSIPLGSLEGGKGDAKKPSSFTIQQVLKGVLVELEHTKNGGEALEIVMDHLEEDPNYYTKLEKIEGGSVTESTDSFGIPQLG